MYSIKSGPVVPQESVASHKLVKLLTFVSHLHWFMNQICIFSKLPVTVQYEPAGFDG